MNTHPFKLQGCSYTATVTWAYPSSPNAIDHKAKNGIWIVYKSHNDNPLDSKQVFASELFEEAAEHAAHICGPVMINDADHKGEKHAGNKIFDIENLPFPSGVYPQCIHHEGEFYNIRARHSNGVTYGTPGHQNKIVIFDFGT